MGSAVVRAAQRSAAFTVAAALTRATGAPARGALDADVVIDFTSDAGARAALEIARGAGASLLVGTTGLAPETLDLLRGESQRRAVLVAPNTSPGATILATLVAIAARALRDTHDVAIVEAHHAMKKDAPSGTALRLAHAASDAGARINPGQILSIRGGSQVGEHIVRFAGPEEVVELSHHAQSRDLFAEGALRAAGWLHGRKPGWWTMEDVLGLPARWREIGA
jgi:4-hydroxy-tetrahydrodipicolinate reductase